VRLIDFANPFKSFLVLISLWCIKLCSGHRVIVLLECEVFADLVFHLLLHLHVCVALRVFFVQVDESNVECDNAKQCQGQEKTLVSRFVWSFKFGLRVTNFFLNVEFLQAFIRLERSAEARTNLDENVMTSHLTFVNLTVDGDCWV